MDFLNILKHMNEHHKVELIGLCKKFGHVGQIKEAKLVEVDFDGLTLEYDAKTLRIKFDQRANAETIKDSIIKLCQSIAKIGQYDEVAKEIQAFKKEFGSIVLSTISESGLPMASYAPLIQLNNRNYIYISATAEHFVNIKTNPKKIEVMFLEDECKAKSIILRKRLRYQAEANFIDRNDRIFAQALDWLENSTSSPKDIKTIRNFTDFHLIELKFLSGRFVKGFGQAYLVFDSGEVQPIGITGNPHSAQPHSTKS